MLLRVLIQLILFVCFSRRVTGGADEMFITVVTIDNKCVYFFVKRSDTIFSLKEKMVAKGTNN